MPSGTRSSWARGGRRLSPRAVQLRIELWGRRQGLGVHVHPHMFRHSFATHLLESSGNLRGVQELLGHADIGTTQVYTHLDFQHLAKVYDAAHPRARRRRTPLERGGARPPVTNPMNHDPERIYGTTILAVRRDGHVAVGGDGQVTLGQSVMKANARKVRRLYGGKVLAGFAGGTADAFTLFERFEGKLEKFGNLTRAAIELAKDWRSDRSLRRLEALLCVADLDQHLRDLRQRRCHRAGARSDRHRFGRRLRASGRAGPHAVHRTPGARDRRALAQHRGGHLHLHQSQSHHRGALDAVSQMTPREIVEELDKHIVGQKAAKRAVAIALRNRWRRQQVAASLRAEITPKNILMIGPTGVGKTEIARRLARLAKAPFIKVEATKFTEVGYVGREVDSIVRDLVEISVKMTREEEMAKVRHRAADAAEDRSPRCAAAARRRPDSSRDTAPRDSDTRQRFRKMLREQRSGRSRNRDRGARRCRSGVEIMAPPGMEEMTQQLQGMFQNLGGGRTRARKLKIREALKLLVDEEAAKMINEEELKVRAVENAEQNGIVFIDEIDKIARRQETAGADVSREGVQRDLLPLVEGCTVNTKYGTVKTDHVLFIASGAFHMSKPSDLIPELQGRLPIRVELEPLWCRISCAS